MKVKSLLVACMFVGLLMYVSCQKVGISQQDPSNPNTLEEKFFNSHRTADLTEKALVEFVKKQNNKLHFVEKTVKQIGFPRWDKAIIKKSSPING
jgi:hypothetical protein